MSKSAPLSSVTSRKAIRSEIDEFNIQIGANIRTRRNSIGMTLVQLGNLVNLSYQQIQKYELGKNPVSAAQLLKISVVLKCPIASFYHGVDSTQPARSLSNDLIPAREIADLNRAFSRIDSPRLRKSLIETVEQISEQK